MKQLHFAKWANPHSYADCGDSVDAAGIRTDTKGKRYRYQTISFSRALARSGGRPVNGLATCGQVEETAQRQAHIVYRLNYVSFR